MARNTVWILLRFLLVYLLLGPLIAILILSNTAAPAFIDIAIIKIKALICFSCITLLFSSVLLKFPITKVVGKLLLLSTLGAVILVFYSEESYWFWFTEMRVGAWTLFLAALYFIMLLYFIFPVSQLKPFLLLIPVAALSWFIVKSLYIPSNVAYELLIKAKLPSEAYQAAFNMLPGIYWEGIQSGLFYVVLLISPYIIVRWGHNPKKTYQSLTRQSKGLKKVG